MNILSIEGPHEDREAWAAAREEIERSRCWANPAGCYPRWRTEVFSAVLSVFEVGIRLAGLFDRGRRNALA